MKNFCLIGSFKIGIKKKWRRIMRLTFFLMIGFILSVSSATYINYGDMTADDMIISPIVTDLFSWDYFTYNSDVTDGLWSSCFSGINKANEVIAYTPDIDFYDEGEKADIIAEAKALRAFYYFQMVRAMGGVPIYETPTAGFDNIYAPRATDEEVYNLIIRDLSDAAAELKPTSPGGRINANVANALLARIYLYRGDFSKALTHARNVINSGQYALYPDYADIFNPANDNGIEHIFQVQYLSGERNNGIPTSCAPRPSVGQYQNSFFAQTVPGGSRAPSADFVAENPDSYRKWATIADHYEHIDGVTGTITMEDAYEGKFPYYICKFDDREAEIASGLNFTVIRYADILLIAAEALNEVDPDNNEKYTLINQIRARARNGVESDLPDLSGLTQGQFRDAVLEERRFELAFEGQRAWDLKRRGLFLETMRAQGRDVEDYMLLFPIPDNQTKLNPNLEQNTGW
jgi:starch-binding outer membrane protein, SusD/RagB family